MDGRRALGALAVSTVVILGGCASPGAGSLAPDTTSPSPLATPSPQTAPPQATPSPTAEPTSRPTPKPTPVPLPPKPSGVKFGMQDEAICGDPRATCGIGDRIVTVSWKAPRTQGVEVRVYGITKCLGTDSDGLMIDGRCLREHTTLPSSVMTLLARVPASKGKVTLSMIPSGSGLADTARGKEVYSIVLAAYNSAAEHSIFAIAATQGYCEVTETPCDSQGGVTMAGEATLGDSPGQLVIRVRMAGLAPGESTTLRAAARYSADWTCGESPCNGEGLCGPAHVETTAGTATATVRAIAHADGTASARVQLAAPPPAAACPVDADASWYGGGERWTRISVTDPVHELSLTPDPVTAHVVY